MDFEFDWVIPESLQAAEDVDDGLDGFHESDSLDIALSNGRDAVHRVEMLQEVAVR